MANSIILAPLIFIICSIFPESATSSSNQTDLLSLLAFKSSLKDPLGSLNSWNQTAPLCTWTGIRCGRRHPDRVVEIRLRSQGLVGSLSPHVGNLSFLRTIILQNNTFHGPIPTEIGRLRRLEVVYLSNNSFTGLIPANLSQCLNLVYLDLVDNKLSGNIPPELGVLSKLESLGLGTNNLSPCPIPPAIGNMTSLAQLSLGSCSLMGEIPETLARLENLFFLQLGNNGLTGTVPPALFNLSAIRYVSVAHNNLEGAIPSTVGLALPNLEQLHLYENQFSGPIPASISNATLLRTLDLSENYFTGTTPRLGKFTRLRSIILQSNLIEDDISFISSLANSTFLNILQLGNNPLTGSLPESIANLSSHLFALTIENARIHGRIPSGIGNLVHLSYVLLSDNYLEGSVPTSIGKISELQELSLAGNRLTNELPSSLGNLTMLNTLYLNGNRLLGNLPSSVGNWTNLLELNLSSNNFGGLIPKEIMSLSSISIFLDLSLNNFEGSIPDEVGSLTNLEALGLSNNRLSGVIPNSLSQCRSLQQLSLERNLLEGEIPSGLSVLMGLQALDLSGNTLSGPIPSFLGSLKLEYLNLSFNKLYGEVPVLGVFKNRTAISLEGNEGLCGGIGELNLPMCPSGKSRKRNFSTLLKVLIPTLVAGGICLVVLVFLNYKKRMSWRNRASYLSTAIGVQFMRLSYADLLKATDGFSESNLVGVGRFGSVYKGTLDDGETFIAVKVLNLVVRGASKSFMAECNALRHIRHRNLVKILSVCESIDFQGNDFKALVYEFKANGSLEKWLDHYREQEEEENGGDIRKLSMTQRLSIAIDIAQAIEYLHAGTDSSIVHGDLKPSNILLDHEMTACVGDFGLAKIVSDIVPSHESTSSVGIRGTIGYVPPEYGMSQLVSVQGDVYSYGIVLLEIFTNRRPIDDLFMNHVNLHSFVGAALPDGVMEIVDPGLQTEAHMNIDAVRNCLAAILSIGVSCSKEMPKDRMPMKEVVTELQKIQKFLSR